jgi:hypothetical protein
LHAAHPAAGPFHAAEMAMRMLDWQGDEKLHTLARQQQFKKLE